MLEYKIQQKNERVRDAAVGQFSHVLSWFLHFLADFLGHFIKAFVEAIKMLIHI